MIDGDRVEEKNCIRQPFSSHDLMQYKADVLRAQLIRDYPELEHQIFSYPVYIDTVEQLDDCVNFFQVQNLILVGCVDNHRARQVMHQYYDRKETILYLDSANEFSVGEVVVSIKLKGVECSPLRSYYYPDVLTDQSPSASELSCGVVNQSSPQHQVTNVMAAHILITLLEDVVNKGVLHGGIVYFDSFAFFTRFQPCEC